MCEYKDEGNTHIQKKKHTQKQAHTHTHTHTKIKKKHSFSDYLVGTEVFALAWHIVNVITLGSYVIYDFIFWRKIAKIGIQDQFRVTGIFIFFVLLFFCFFF